MRTTCQQDRDFLEMFLESASIDFDTALVLVWVAENFAPEDVYDEMALSDWAIANGFVEEE